MHLFHCLNSAPMHLFQRLDSAPIHLFHCLDYAPTHWFHRLDSAPMHYFIVWILPLHIYFIIWILPVVEWTCSVCCRGVWGHSWDSLQVVLSDAAATSEPYLELVFSHFAYNDAAMCLKCIQTPPKKKERKRRRNKGAIFMQNLAVPPLIYPRSLHVS